MVYIRTNDEDMVIMIDFLVDGIKDVMGKEILTKIEDGYEVFDREIDVIVKTKQEVKEDMEKVGYFVDNYEEPKVIEGKIYVLYYNEIKGFWTEYKEIPETNEQIQAKRITDLENSVMELTLKLAKVGA